MLENLRKDLRQNGRAWLATALTVAFGLQLLRVLFVGFVGYLRDAQGMGSLDLAPIAIGVFALSLLAALPQRFLGARNALWLTAGGVAVVRFAEQLAQSASLDLYLAVIGVALFLMYIPLAVGIARAKSRDAAAHFGLAFLLGISIDLALHVAGGTLDLSWQRGIFPIVVGAALAFAQIWALRAETSSIKETHDGSWLAALCLLALGPWLFLQIMVFQNIGLFASLTGWQLPAVGALLIIANAIGLWLAAQVAHPPRGPVNVILAGLFMTVPLFMMFSGGPAWLAALWLLLGQVFSFTFGMLIFLGTIAKTETRGLLRSALMHGLGQIFFVLLVFIYYASYDIDFGLQSGSLLPIAALMAIFALTLGYQGKRAAAKAQARNYSPALLAAALLLIPLALFFTWKSLDFTEAPAGTTAVRIMDYNLHDAVNAGGRLDPEALARVIEESGADIVGLQEISRGWLVWGDMDMLLWLSQRLDMPYVWGPTADAQWGNAVLSRFPIVSHENIPLPPDDVLLLRGHLLVEIDIDGTILTLINTHFSEKDDQDAIRAIQASALLDTWSGRSATVFMGDLNDTPESEAIQILLNASLTDVSSQLGIPPVYTYSSKLPEKQIDYIFVTSDLGYSDFIIADTQASDHLPLVVTIILP